MQFERISIELTNRCQKGCWFCYNHSHANGGEAWTLEELTGFILDCREHGTKAVSLGGGEPLQSPLLIPLLKSLHGRLFRSFTTNGLLLDEPMLDTIAAAEPDKVHVSIHFPDSRHEVTRVTSQVHSLANRGIRSGVNLLVARSHLPAAAEAARSLRASGIGNDRIVYLPMRGQDTPTPAEMAQVAGGAKFQSMTCLAACGRSPRFCSIGWDRQAAWCSYTVSRRPLATLTHARLVAAMTDLPLTFCGGTDVN
jgi:sulfatase maturation enzyme AslB (radical SAM superfamily)